MEKEIQRFAELNEQLKKLETKKIRLEEQFKAKKKELTELVAGIKEDGYDPNKLKDIIEEKEAELKACLKQFEEDVQKSSNELAKVEV